MDVRRGILRTDGNYIYMHVLQAFGSRKIDDSKSPIT